MEFCFLSAAFYERYGNCEEILVKQDRPYTVLIADERKSLRKMIAALRHKVLVAAAHNAPCARRAYERSAEHVGSGAPQ